MIRILLCLVGLHDWERYTTKYMTFRQCSRPGCWGFRKEPRVPLRIVKGPGDTADYAVGEIEEEEGRPH